LFSAKVQGGVIVAQDVALPEGATVIVVLEDDTANDNVEATAEQLVELDEAIAEADRGEGIPWQTVRADLFGNR
jgi:hypothetical protein